MLEIKSIFWKYKAVGINVSKISEATWFKVTVKDKEGNYYYPSIYKINRKEVLEKYKVEKNNKGVSLVYIPTDELYQYEDIAMTAKNLFKH